MQKPSAKFIVVFNLVQNIPTAIAMSVTAPLLVHQPVFTINLLANILIGFVLATLINLLIPIPKIAMGFPALFKLNPEGFAGRTVGNIPVCFIFHVIIGLVLNLYNVRAGFPVRLFGDIYPHVPGAVCGRADFRAHRQTADKK